MKHFRIFWAGCNDKVKSRERCKSEGTISDDEAAEYFS